jgi:hypothetical protein
MTKAELLKLLEPYDPSIEVRIQVLDQTNSEEFPLDGTEIYLKTPEGVFSYCNKRLSVEGGFPCLRPLPDVPYVALVSRMY